MTVTDLCVNKSHLSRSYLNHLVHEFWNNKIEVDQKIDGKIK
jgi:hypothetical protein